MKEMLCRIIFLSLLSIFAILSVSHAEEIKQAESMTLFSRIPPVVRGGDQFRGCLVVMNRTDRSMLIDIIGHIKEVENGKLKSHAEALAAGESKELVWDIFVPHGISALTYEFKAQERDGAEEADLTINQKVIEAVPLRTVNASLSQVETYLDIEVGKPEGAIGGKGGITITIVPQLSDSFSALESAVALYPFPGLAQEISKSVVLRDDELWNKTIKELPNYLDEFGLVKHLPRGQHGDIGLTSFVFAMSDETGWDMPEGLKKHMEEGLKAVVEDRIPRYRQLPDAELLTLRLSALEALSRIGIVQENSLLEAVNLETLPSSSVLDMMNILSRSTTLPDHAERLQKTRQVLHSRMRFVDGQLEFSKVKTDTFPSLMASDDAIAARLLLTYINRAENKEEIPGIMAGFLKRQRNGAWQSHMANAWGVMAAMKYSREFASKVPSGKTRVEFGGIERHIDWSGGSPGLRMRFSWPQKKELLTIHHQGMGRPWVTIQGTASVPRQENVSAGLSLQKVLVPVEQRKPEAWTEGDLVKVRLVIDAPRDLFWIVINDPLPGGAALIDSGKAPEKRVVLEDEKQTVQLIPNVELSSPAEFRAYLEFLPKGIWSGEYLIRLESAGLFSLPGTRVEALHSPEIFSELSYTKMKISQRN